MTTTKELSNNEKDLLLKIVLNSKYALELVGNEIGDIENGNKAVSEDHLKEINKLYDRLVAAGL